MVNVFLHGRLGKEYGKSFRFSVARPHDVISAIDANKPGFYSRLIELAKKGCNYAFIVDGRMIENPHDISSRRNIKEVSIVPMIVGAAGVALAVGAIAAIAGTFGASLGISAGVAALLVAVGTAAISFGIQNLLQKDSQTEVGSNSATANALNKSFLFSNGENVTEQGNPVPLGYGYLRIGSAVVQSTIKSFPSKSTTFDEFTSLATKKGQSQMAIVDSQRQLQVLPTEEV